jgi:hypothetical protein
LAAAASAAFKSRAALELENLALWQQLSVLRRGDCLASERIPVVLDLESSSRPAWAAGGPERRARTDPKNEPRESVLGAPRIHGELLKLGIDVGETHLSLAKYTPEERPVHPPDLGPVIAIPHFGGLHHRYERRAA